MPFIMNTMFDRSCLVSEESNITVSKQTNKKGGGGENVNVNVRTCHTVSMLLLHKESSVQVSPFIII